MKQLMLPFRILWGSSENTPTRNMDYVYFLLIALDCDGLVYYGQVT
jgi:hypothetical protein